MKKAEALRIWRADILPMIRKHYERDGVPDKPRRRESWGFWTDLLCREGKITMRQYETWDQPRENR